MHLLTWIGVAAIVLSSLVFVVSAVIGLAQRIALARARVRRALGAHPFRDGEPAQASVRGPALVWPSLGLLAIAATSLALTPAGPPPLTPQQIAAACTSAVAIPPAPPAPMLPVVAPVPSAPLTFEHGPIEGGRSATLRMSQPVTGLDVVDDEGGFTATMFGALSLDRAGPIAAGNPDIERASILNRGDHCVLTVRWVSGRSPTFRVAVRRTSIDAPNPFDDLEVTVGR